MKNILIILILLIVFLGAPLTFHFFIPSSVIAGALTVLLLGILIKGKHHISKYEQYWVFVWLIYTLGLLILAIVHYFYGVNEFRKVLGFSIKLLFIISAIIITRLYLEKTVKYLNTLTILQLLLIGAGVIIIFLKIVDIKPIEILLENGRKYYHYYITGASNTVIRFSKRALIRPTGYFEEPGAVALFLTWILVLNEFTFKNKKLIILIVILGMFLRSLAFIFTLVVFFSVRLLEKKDFKLVFKILISLGVFIFLLLLLDLPHIEYAVNNIVHRITVQNDGALGGDNRRMLEMFEYINIKNIFFGIGNENVREIHYSGGPTGASAAGFLLKYGMFGYLFLYLPFLYLLYIYRKDKRIIYFIVIAVNFIQRPGIDELYIILIMTILIQLKNPQIKEKYYAVFNNNH